MTTPTDDRRDLLTVIAYMKAAPGKEEELRVELEALIEPTSQEDGFVNYDLHQSVEDPAPSSSTRTGSPPSSSTPTSPRRTWSGSPTSWVTCSTRTA